MEEKLTEEAVGWRCSPPHFLMHHGWIEHVFWWATVAERPCHVTWRETMIGR